MEKGVNNSIRYKGVLVEKTVLQGLPDEVKAWLEYHNSLPPEIQEMVNFEPHELTHAISGGLTVNTPATVFIAGTELNPPVRMYDAQGFPSFFQVYWNGPNLIRRANCYAHAMGVIANVDEKLQPGEINNVYLNLSGTDLNGAANAIKANAMADATSGKLSGIKDLQECMITDVPNINQYKVALVAAPLIGSNLLLDYHWYRQNGNGTWSHKPGLRDAVQTDAAGNYINAENPPHLCNRNYRSGQLNYLLFVNYLMVTHL